MAKKSSSGGSKSGNARSADSGRYVTKEFAKSHPKTTVVESRPGKPNRTGPGKKK